MEITLFSKQHLTGLLEKARDSERLRYPFDLRTSLDDKSQRMLNALQPGTIMPIHRHMESAETVVYIEGCLDWVFYDENGLETERVTLDANDETRMLNVERDRWHSLQCLESGSVLYESKDGPYHPAGRG